MGHSVALNFADGKTFFIGVNNNELLLDAAIRQGITLPLDCREGVCATCQGQCESGQYEQDYVDEDALTEQDLKNRKILACQTRVQSNAAFYFDHASDFCQTGQTKRLQTRVEAITWLSEDTVKLELDIQNAHQAIQYLAGQYARIYIPDTNEHRAYSFAQASNTEQTLTFLIRYLTDGVMGQFLKERCSIGQNIEIELPFGSFYLRQTHRHRPLYFIAGGTGLSAFLAMLDECEHLTEIPPIHLYYAVRYEHQLCEEERIKAYQERLPELHYYPVVSRPSEQWSGLKGYVQTHLDAVNLNSQAFDLYVCGAPALIEGIKTFLTEQDIENYAFYSEKFLSSATHSSN